MFWESTCIKHRKYQRILRLHFPWQQATKSKNTDIYIQRFCEMIFPKKCSFWTIFGFWSFPKEGAVPSTPFHILNFKIFTKSKVWQFGAQDASAASFFDGCWRCFLHVPQFFRQKIQYQKLSPKKNAKKNSFLLVFSFLVIPPFAPD